MHDIVCFVFYQSSVLVIEVIIGDMSKKKKKRVCAHICPHLPVVKGRQTECLSLGVRPQICFKSKRVNSRNEGFDEVEGGARYRGVLGHMTSGGRGRGSVGDTVRWLTQQTITKC